MEQQRNFEDKLIRNDKHSEPPVLNHNAKVVNKQGPEDWKKMQECAAVVKKLKEEKRDREEKLKEIQRKHDEKINAEVAERHRVMQQKLNEEQ